MILFYTGRIVRRIITISNIFNKSINRYILSILFFSTDYYYFLSLSFFMDNTILAKLLF